ALTIPAGRPGAGWPTADAHEGVGQVRTRAYRAEPWIPEVKCGRGGFAAKQIPPRPGLAPALGLRAGGAGIPMVPQTCSRKESIMSLFTWLRNRPSTRAPGSRAQPRPAAARFRPRLEALEDRWLPSQVALTVTTLADEMDPNDGALSLREAILMADAGSH